MDEQSLIRHPQRAVVPAPSAPDGRPVTVVDIPTAEERLQSYLHVIYRHRFLVAGAAIAAVAVTIAYTASRPDIYEARAQVLLEAGGPNVVTFTPVTDEWGSTDYYNTQYEILRSRSLAERTMDALNLWSHPEFGGGNVTELTRAVRAGRVRAFLGRLQVAQVRQSRIAEIRFRSGDPMVAAEAANGLARTYIEQTVETRAQPNTDAAQSLRNLIAEQKKAVAASEEALQRYREQRATTSLDEGQNIVVQRMVQLGTAVTEARTDRIQKATLYEQLRSIQENRAPLDSLPAVLSNSFVQGLKLELATLQRREAELGKQLGDLHPDMIQLRSAIATAEAKLRAEIAHVAEAVRNDSIAAEAREKALARDLAAQERQVLALDRTSIAYGNLQREAATNRQIYENLLQRAKETEVASSVRDANVRIVDTAEVPQAPISKGTLLYSVLALLWGSALGVGLAFTREFLDSDRIKSPQDVHRYLAVPFLGFAPEMASLTNPKIPCSDLAPLAETMRGVSAAMLGAPADARGSVLVTSATKGEGKSLVAGMLAASLARVGQRVILIDADLRRPRVHELFDTDRGPGLADLLLESAKLSAVIQGSSTPGLWIIPSGRGGPSDLLGTERFRQLVATLAEAFDWVVVDSPPVLAVADTSFIAQAVSNVLLVVRANATKRLAAQAAIERLDALNARPAGVVLNRADLERNADFYYPYYSDDYDEYHVGDSRSSRSA